MNKKKQKLSLTFKTNKIDSRVGEPDAAPGVSD